MMIKISTVLPLRYRLDIKIIRVRIARREVKNASNKISSFFRRIFEHKHVRRVLGSNIALAVIASSFLPVSASNISETVEETYISSNVVSLKTEGHIQYPLDKIKLNQGYNFFHPGIDFEGITGDPVKPVMAGVVEAVGYSKVAYGNSILINHGNDYVSLYAHLSKIYIKKGDKVDLTSVIGAVGSTGRSSGDHLHLEIRENGRPIAPLTLLPKL
jgi:hypothetical protein